MWEKSTRRENFPSVFNSNGFMTKLTKIPLKVLHTVAWPALPPTLSP